MNKDDLLNEIYKWSKSERTYTCRFGVGMLMSFFLDGDFKEEYLKLPANIKSEEYYINMMIAWYFATALTKQYEATIPYIESKTLSPFVQNKSIQKARESRRISEDTKKYLLQFKL